jgi:hypothetical protein
VFNVMKKARGAMCAFWLFLFRQWTLCRTCDGCWDAPSPSPEPSSPPPSPSRPPVLRIVPSPTRREATAKAKSPPATGLLSARAVKAYARMVATLSGVIDWSTKLSMRALLSKIDSPLFLKSLSSSGIVRFALWQRIDSAPPASWEQRPKPTDQDVDATQGVPIEVMVDVANQTGLDPWFCMPHWADDAYVKSFAELVKDKLDPERVVYIEHSNDVANSALPQHHYLRATARSSVARFGEDCVGAAIKCHAARSLEIFRIWREVFEDRESVVGVLGACATEEKTLGEIFSHEAVRESVDAVVLAPVMDGVIGEVADAFDAAVAPLGKVSEIVGGAVSDLTTALSGAAKVVTSCDKRLFVCSTEAAPQEPE